jgi:hypothetical protein
MRKEDGLESLRAQAAQLRVRLERMRADRREERRVRAREQRAKDSCGRGDEPSKPPRRDILTE